MCQRGRFLLGKVLRSSVAILGFTVAVDAISV